MLDIHPPEHTPHSWREFFIHIATIVVGLVIAVGLEQTVVAIQHHSERAKLREDLQGESRQIIHDTEIVERGEIRREQWLTQTQALLSSAAASHQPTPPLPPSPVVRWDCPDEPVFRAAKSSGKLALLSDEEVVAYGEEDGVMDQLNLSYQRHLLARLNLEKVQSKLAFGRPPGEPFLAHASLDRLEQYNAALADMNTASHDFRFWYLTSLGASRTILRGDYNLHDIQDAEKATAPAN